MKNNKWLVGLSLIIFSAIWGGGVANATSSNQMTKAVQIQSQNKRHKMPQADRKAAALRLKQTYAIQQQQKLVKRALLKKGYTGHGQRGRG